MGLIMKDSLSHARVCILPLKKNNHEILLIKKEIPKSLKCYIIELSIPDRRKISLKSVEMRD